MIVCNNDLVRLDGLIEYAVDRLPEVMFLVIRCNNDADARSRHVKNQATGLVSLTSGRKLFISEFIADRRHSARSGTTGRRAREGTRRKELETERGIVRPDLCARLGVRDTKDGPKLTRGAG